MPITKIKSQVIDTLSPPLSVNSGGSGTTALTGYLIGNGTSAFTASTTIPVAALTGTLSATAGGTGLSSPSTAGNVLTSNGSGWVSQAPTGGIGDGQTWQAVTRTGGVTYTNSTGKPIMVSLYGAGTLQIYVNDVLAGQSTVNNAANSITVIVPNGAQYRTNSTSIIAELR